MKKLLFLAALLYASTAFADNGEPYKNLGTAQVTCAGSATLAAAARHRNGVTIKVPTGGVTVYIGPTGVTTVTGFSVDAGTAMTLEPYSGAVYCVASTGTQVVSIAETF